MALAVWNTCLCQLSAGIKGMGTMPGTLCILKVLFIFLFIAVFVCGHVSAVPKEARRKNQTP